MVFFKFRFIDELTIEQETSNFLKKILLCFYKIDFFLLLLLFHKEVFNPPSILISTKKWRVPNNC